MRNLSAPLTGLAPVELPRMERKLSEFQVDEGYSEEHSMFLLSAIAIFTGLGLPS